MHVELLKWDDAREAARAVRYSVFVEEQGVPVELEWDDNDVSSWHALARHQNGQVQGTGRLLPDGHIGRMAVLKTARGAGVGGMILQRLIQQARALNYPIVLLNAQTQAQNFYIKYGFTPYGAEFMEANIPHIAMEQKL